MERRRLSLKVRMINLTKKIRRYFIDYRYPIDFYFLSFPKSGRTWIRLFLSKYYSFYCGKNYELDLENINLYNILPRIRFTHMGSGGMAKIRNLDKSIIANKRHIQKLKFAMSSKKLIYLSRNPIDVFVSYFHHLTKRNIPTSSKIDFSNISAGELLRTEEYGIRNILEYDKYWKEYVSKHPQSYSIKYEDFKLEPHSSFTNLLHFLGLEVDSEKVSQAIDYTRIDKMRIKYKTGDKRLSPKVPEDINSFKFRRGIIGSYKDELSAEEIEYCNMIISDYD